MTIADNLRQVGEFNVSTEVDPHFFEGHENSALWIGSVAVLGNVTSTAHDATLKFVADRYIDAHGFRDDHTRDEYGRSVDPDAHRITRLAAIENRVNSDGLPIPRIIGSMAIIVKKNKRELPLPIEKAFPEASVVPLGKGSAEVHDYAVSHEDKSIKHLTSLGLVRALIFQGLDHNIEYGYAMVEDKIKRLYDLLGVEIDTIAEPKIFVEPQGEVELIPTRLNYKSIPLTMSTDKTGNPLASEFFLGESANRGQGFYPMELVNGVK